MKNEKIIANIEKYVSTLDSEKQKEFNFILATAEKDRKAVKQVFKTYYNQLIELAEIMQEAKAELKQAAQKEAGGASLVKRTKLLNKLLAKNNNDRFKDGYYEEINGEKMQCCIIDGFYAFAFRNEIDIPTAKNINSLSLQKFFANYEKLEKCDYDLTEIKTAYKLFKARSDKTERHCKIEICGRFYSAEYFINVIELLGGSDIKMYHDSKNLNAAVFESENGFAILMPLRP